MDASEKFGDSRLNLSRDIRLPHFVTNSHINNDNDAGVSRSSPNGVLPKNTKSCNNGTAVILAVFNEF